MWMIPEITRRSFTRRAPGWSRGMNGPSTAHCASDCQNSSTIAHRRLRLQRRRSERDYQGSRKYLIEFRP